MILSADPQVTFGGLDLFGENDLDGVFFTLETIGTDGGLDWGAPEAVQVWIKSLLMDGSMVATQRYDNRTVSLQVKITSDSADGLMKGEEALFLTCPGPTTRATTLTWRPPDDTAATTVFVVSAAKMTPILDDDLDERRRVRYYQLELTCQPFTRSVDEVVETITPLAIPTDTPTLIDECTVLTNWTASDTLSLVSAQAVRCTDTTPSYHGSVWLKRTASVTITKSYIRVKGNVSIPTSTMQIALAGVAYSPVAAYGGYVWFDVPTGTYSSITVYGSYTYDFVSMSDPVQLTVWSLYQTDVASLGTRRELTAVKNIGGSARTPATIEVTHPSNGLGDVVVYTYPTAMGPYSPSLSGYRTGGGGITADTNLVSGGRENLASTPTYTIDQINLPAGVYELVVRIRHTSTGLISFRYTAVCAGITTDVTVKVNILAANTWQVTTIDWLELPPARVKPTSDRQVTVTLNGPAGSELDIGWLFHTDGAYSIVPCGSEKSLTIQAPTVDEDGGAVYVGDAYPSLDFAWGRHQFIPPQIGFYLATTGTEDAAASLRYYYYWFTNAGI